MYYTKTRSMFSNDLIYYEVNSIILYKLRYYSINDIMQRRGSTESKGCIKWQFWMMEGDQFEWRPLRMATSWRNLWMTSFMTSLMKGPYQDEVWVESGSATRRVPSLWHKTSLKRTNVKISDLKQGCSNIRIARMVEQKTKRFQVQSPPLPSQSCDL